MNYEKLRSQLNGSNVSYFLSDHLGSTNGLTNTSSVVIASNSYDILGNATNSSFPSRYQFTGREFDNFTGLQFSRARFYDPNLGRFISEDPIGFGGGDVNLYGYVWNSPNRFRDPFGLDARYDEQLWRAQQDLIDFLAPSIRFGMGFGDTTLFGFSRSLRQWQGIDEPDLDCSVAYQAGGWTAIAVQAAAGGVGGLRAAGGKAAGVEFSHWIPRRLGGPRSIFNGNYVTIAEHALTDPFRFRFMPRIWKSINPMLPPLLQQWYRVPRIYKGVGTGAAVAATSSSLTNSNCECK